MKKLALIIPALLISATLALAGTTFFSLPANGSFKAPAGPVKIVAIDVIGATSNQTVVLKRTATAGSATLATVLCSNAVEQVSLSNSLWLFKGDVIERSGTATRASVRLIVQ